MSEFKGEIPSITSLANSCALNAKIIETKGEARSITNLASTSAFTTVENRIPNISYLVKRADYDARIKDIKN